MIMHEVIYQISLCQFLIVFADCIAYYKREKKYTYVSITDMRGDLIYYSEGVKNHNGFLKAINIDKLVNGKYKIKVASKGKVLTQIFQVSGDHVYFSNFK